MSDDRELLRECLPRIESVCRQFALESDEKSYNAASRLRSAIRARLSEPAAPPVEIAGRSPVREVAGSTPAPADAAAWIPWGAGSCARGPSDDQMPENGI